MLNIRRILHPTDLSANARHAFEIACGFARDYNAELIVLGVVTHPIAMGTFGGFGTEWTDERQSMERNLAAIEPTQKGLSLQRAVVEDESAAKAIVRFASEHVCDLIVMGSHGRTGIERLVLGSVAEEVTHKARCPVLVIRDASRWLMSRSASNDVAASRRVEDERTSCV
jgi:nucleotide-binding universal stress UspA family protein